MLPEKLAATFGSFMTLTLMFSLPATMRTTTLITVVYRYQNATGHDHER
jgi:hypothetical protein